MTNIWFVCVSPIVDCQSRQVPEKSRILFCALWAPCALDASMSPRPLGRIRSHFMIRHHGCLARQPDCLCHACAKTTSLFLHRGFTRLDAVETDIFMDAFTRLSVIGHDGLPRARECLGVLEADAVLEHIRAP